MKTALVGYTGFVGSNIAAAHSFDALYNSKNITEAYGSAPDLLIYAGVKAEMFLANKFPDDDLREIEGACENIRKINPRNVVLISTIGVYADTSSGDETTTADNGSLPPYGRNRLYLENRVREQYPQSLIVRLPALFGKNIKKNFIYDMIHIVPKLLKEDKYHELLDGSEFAHCYTRRPDGFYACTCTGKAGLDRLKEFFKTKGFTALNFTDSRSIYQFFNLKNLWGLIERCLSAGLRLLTVTSEPVSAAEVYAHVFGSTFVNEINPGYPVQDLRSIHAGLFSGHNGYIYPKERILNEIKTFIIENSDQ